MAFADIHIHALSGVDDGAKTEAEMRAMVDASYADGVRLLCVTPHFHPGYFGENGALADRAYEKLEAYVRQRYGDLELFRGNELRYSGDCVSWLDGGQCRTLNGTRFVLVDFSEGEEARRIANGLDRLLNGGYRPVLAHVERYRSLFGKLREIQSYCDNGVLLQMDTQSPLGGFGFRVRQQSRELLARGMLDLVCSDGHDTKRRPPQMSECCRYIQKKVGPEYAQLVCYDNGARILRGTSGEDFEER